MILVGYDGNGAFSSVKKKAEELSARDDVCYIDVSMLSDIDAITKKLKGKVDSRTSFFIGMHGGMVSQRHHISLSRTKNIFTADLFKKLAMYSDGQPLNVVVQSCYAGGLTDVAVSHLPQGSSVITGTSHHMISTSRDVSENLLLEGLLNNRLSFLDTQEQELEGRPVDELAERAHSVSSESEVAVEPAPDMPTLASKGADNYGLNNLYILWQHFGLAPGGFNFFVANSQDMQASRFDGAVDYSEFCQDSFMEARYSRFKSFIQEQGIVYNWEAFDIVFEENKHKYSKYFKRKNIKSIALQACWY